MRKEVTGKLSPSLYGGCVENRFCEQVYPAVFKPSER
jgi:hypothetical protein